ncbi:MAG: TolC family protein [Sulfurisoma sp.]|nr:TolC family protein [Sulfurisoma sp.]
MRPRIPFYCFHRLGALCCALALLAPPALAGPPLTEGEALRIGLSRTELNDWLRAGVAEAEADAVEAGLWPNPTLDLGRDRTSNAREDRWQIAQTLDISGRRGLRRDAAERRVAAAERDGKTRRAAVAADIRRLFHQALLRQEGLAAIQAWAQRFANAETTFAKLKKSGEVSGYDLRRLSRERQTAEVKAAEVGAELARNRERLAALIGRPVETLSGRLAPEAPAPIQGLLVRLAERPDLAALLRRAEAAELERQAAARGAIPDITLGLGRKNVTDNGLSDSGNLVSVSIALPLFDRQQAADSRGAARALGLKSEAALSQARAEGDVRGLHRQTALLTTAAASFRERAVTPSADLVRIAEAAYRAGESTLLELLDAYRGALDAELTALDLEWKARETRIELDQLTGSHAE